MGTMETGRSRCSTGFAIARVAGAVLTFLIATAAPAPAQAPIVIRIGTASPQGPLTTSDRVSGASLDGGREDLGRDGDRGDARRSAAGGGVGLARPGTPPSGDLRGRANRDAWSESCQPRRAGGSFRVWACRPEAESGRFAEGGLGHKYPNHASGSLRIGT